jgi:hypothetical protein
VVSVLCRETYSKKTVQRKDQRRQEGPTSKHNKIATPNISERYNSISTQFGSSE